MDETIEVSLDRLRAIIQTINSDEFSTGDVIREYSSGFFFNKNTLAHYSFNAQFGKLLKRNMSQLGIREIAANVSIKDDLGQETSASVWARNA
ncbi:MAG: hypothetical protein JSS31_06845 [Proteobacteria bacterium]|nr:hypothetical protein [Pseudomonadota bacterium]